MGLYSKHVLPRLINLAMSNRDVRRLRAAWIPEARGEVLEAGIGSGLNLEFYSSSKVTRVIGVDPSIELQKIARKRPAPVPVEWITQSAEHRLPLADSTIDTAILTWTLCSIPDAPRALAEIRRLLKPAGKLIFIEHGRAPEESVRGWQDRITPVWKHATGGCHLNRKIDELISGAGLRITELNKSYMAGPRPLTFTYQGVAEPLS